MNTREQKKLSESLLAACKAAGIKDPKYIAQDRNRDIYHFNEKPIVSTAQCFWFGDNEDGFYLDHPPYADDWQDSLLEWVEPEESLSEWKDGLRFTETEKQQIDALADEPLANVLARHPEHIADTSKMIDACDIAYQKMNDEYAGRRTFEMVYRRAWSDALAWWDAPASERAEAHARTIGKWKEGA